MLSVALAAAYWRERRRHRALRSNLEALASAMERSHDAPSATSDWEEGFEASERVAAALIRAALALTAGEPS